MPTLTYSLMRMEDIGKDLNILSQLDNLTIVASGESETSCMNSFLRKLRAGTLKKGFINKSAAILVREKGSKDIIAWCLMTTIVEKERKQVFQSPEGETEEIDWFYGPNHYTNAHPTGKTRNTQCNQFFISKKYREQGIGKELVRRSKNVAEQHKRTYAIQGWDRTSYAFFKKVTTTKVRSMWNFIAEVMEE